MIRGSLNKRRAGSRGSRTLAVALVAAYFILTHIDASSHALRYGLLAILCGAAVAGVLGGNRFVWIGAAAIAAPLCLDRFDPRLLIYLPPVVVNLLLCWFFGRSLVGGREPIISVIARLDRGPLPDELACYTRGLTWVWAVFFALTAAASAMLALFAPSELWTVFNDVSYLFAGLLFFGEFVYRRVRYRHYPHSSALHVIRHIRRTRDSGAFRQ